MSGICGIYGLDGAPVAPAALARMTDSQAHRGPDGDGTWCDGPVGLGHQMLHTTPESLHEHLPLADPAGDLVVTADARLDNRDELIRALELDGRPPERIPDGRLILGAYRKWGTHCPEKLLGAFAFVVWDARKRQLFCARDHFGVKPFCYYRSARLFAFASEIKALLCLPRVPRRLNEERVAAYLASLFDNAASTFYREILRLPPAHALVVSPERARLWRYWSLDPEQELRLGSDAAYAEAFRERFTQAVCCRLRSAGPVGALLSGGLDSSSVTCVASRLLAQSGGPRLKTFSAVFDRVPECDERPFIRAVVAQNGVEPHYVAGDRVGPLHDLDRVHWHQDEPFYAPGLTLTWQLFDAAQRQGVRVLLDGFDGDSTVSHGFGRLHELARADRWLALAVELRGLSRFYGESFWKDLWLFARHYRLDPLVSGSRILSRGRWAWRGVRRRLRRDDEAAGNRLAWDAVLNPAFVERTGLAERRRVWQESRSAARETDRKRHHQGLTAGVQPFALEVFDRSAAAFDIEPRYPFWDRRLVEFCLALPPEQKLHRGWSRMVLRRAMDGVLPAEVQWRTDKLNFTPNFSRGLLTLERRRVESVVLGGARSIEEYVDVPALREAYRHLTLEETTKASAILTVWKAVSLALWLRSAGFGQRKEGELREK